MTITFTFLNDATGQPDVYLDRPALDTFTLHVTTDGAPVEVGSLAIRFPPAIVPVPQVGKITVTAGEWRTEADGPRLTLSPIGPVPTLSGAQPLTIGLAGVSPSGTTVVNGDVQVTVGGESPRSKLFLTRYPTRAGDLTTALDVELPPAVVYRTPDGDDTLENVLTLRIIHRDQDGPLVTGGWQNPPTVLLSFVYGEDIGSLTTDGAPVVDPWSAYNIQVDVSATYADDGHRHAWTALPPVDREAGDPVWTLRPVKENQEVLGTGSGSTAEFRLSGIRTKNPPGSTLALLQFSDFPGYDDTHVAIPLSTEVPVPGIVFFDSSPTYVAALGDPVTLRWQTVQMARVDLLRDGVPVPGPFDAANGGSGPETIDRNTAFTLQAFRARKDTQPARSAQWTARVPDARITGFTSSASGVVAGSEVDLSWTTEFARAATITDDQTHDIAADQLATGSMTVYPEVPTTYTLHVTGEGQPPDRHVRVVTVPRGWATRPMGFSPDAVGGPVLYGTGTGLTLVGGQARNAVFRSADGARWENIGTAPFPARTDAAGTAFDGKLWIMGGMQGGAPGNDVWCSADDGLTWTRVTPDAGWSARTGPACVTWHDRLWILGGRDAGGNRLDDVWSSVDGVTWTQAPAAGTQRWAPRSRPAVAVVGDQLYLFGGLRTDGVDNDLWCTTDGSTWTWLQGSGGSGTWPYPRQRAVLGQLDGQPFVFSGLNSDGTAIDDQTVYTFDGRTWWPGDTVDGWTIGKAGWATWQGAYWFAGGFVQGRFSPPAPNPEGNATVWSWLPEVTP